jgi:hypothetical protein
MLLMTAFHFTRVAIILDAVVLPVIISNRKHCMHGSLCSACMSAFETPGRPTTLILNY